MKWFANLKLGVKLISGFILVALIAGTIGMVGYFSINSIGKERLPGVSNLLEIEKEFTLIGTYENMLLNPKLSYEDRIEIYKKIENTNKQIKLHWEAFEKIPLSPKEADLWGKIETAFTKWEQSHKKFVDLSIKLDELGIDDPQEVRYQIALRQRDHVNWIWQLSESIDNLNSFTGQLDGTKCALGIWLEDYETRSPRLKELMSEIQAPHLKVHESAGDIKKLIEGNAEDKQTQARRIYRTTSLTNMNTVLKMFQEMDAIVEESDTIFEEMLTISNNEVVVHFNETADLIGNIVDENLKLANNEVRNSSILIIGFMVFGVMIAILLGLIISNMIKKPVNKLVEVSEQIASGNLDVAIHIDTKDEIGILAKSFKIMTDNLNEVMSNIKTASEQVAAGSKQVSDSSMELSHGATEQASSVQQLTASLEEISSQTKLNAENANEANQLAENAKTNAIQGNSQMAEMLKAMDEINSSSNNISKIIKVIDEIAFQTNILALNAAVEAARAGQHGKGFAVVAEEVRNLAARSANAAKETTAMIEGSIKKVEGGTKIANETASALDRIVEIVAKVAHIVGDIAVASNEQALGIAQINQGIMQVSDVVQSNTATSEESAAASEELASQTEILKEQVGRFSLRKTYNNSTSLYKNDELNPDILRMLDEMKNKKRIMSEDYGFSETAASKKNKITLNDKDFGKY